MQFEWAAAELNTTNRHDRDGLCFASLSGHCGSSRVHQRNARKPPMFRNIAPLVSLSARAMKKHCEEKSMTNRFLISVAAAALIAGTGFANAQGAGGASREGAGSTVQQSAPPSGGGAAQQAPQHRESQQPGMKSGQSDKAPGAGKEAQDMKGGKPQPNTASDSDRGKTGKDMKAEGREGREKSTVGQAPDKSGAPTKGHDDKMGREDKMGGQGREDRMNAQGQKGSTDTNRAQQN